MNLKKYDYTYEPLTQQGVEVDAGKPPPHLTLSLCGGKT